MAKRVGWAAREKALLKRLFNDGCIDAEIAERLPGRSEQAVRSQRKNMGLRRRARGRAAEDTELARIRELAGQGLSAAAIGKDVGRTRNSIIRICTNKGITLQGRSTAGKADKAHGGRKGGQATAAKARSTVKKRKPEGFRFTDNISPEELEERRAEARQENKRSPDMERRLAEAARGALNLPLVTVKKKRVVTWRNRAKHPYRAKHYHVTSLRQTTEHGPGQCRFPVTEELPHAFCGKTCAPDSAWCPDHHGICHTGKVVKLPYIGAGAAFRGTIQSTD